MVFHQLYVGQQLVNIEKGEPTLVIIIKNYGERRRGMAIDLLVTLRETYLS